MLTEAAVCTNSQNAMSKLHGHCDQLKNFIPLAVLEYLSLLKT